MKKLTQVQIDGLHPFGIFNMKQISVKLKKSSFVESSMEKWRQFTGVKQVVQIFPTSTYEELLSMVMIDVDSEKEQDVLLELHRDPLVKFADPIN